MLSIFRQSKLFLILIILTNILSSTSFSLTYLPSSQNYPDSYFTNNKSIIHQLYNEDGLLVYDAVIHLLEEIEDGTLEEVCSEQDFIDISYFLAFLVKQSIMPNTSLEEKEEIEKDIQELLDFEDNYFLNLSYNTDHYQIIPAILYENLETTLCKNWFKNQFKHAKKFVKKHPVAVTVGAVVVVAAVAVVVIVPLTTSAAIAATGAAAAASYEGSKEEPCFDLIAEPLDDSYEQMLDNQILNFKDIRDKNNISIPFSNYYLDNGRFIGLTLAHETIKNIPQDIPSEIYEQVVIQEHQQIDNAFSTDQSSFYIDNDSFDISHDFSETVSYMQGTHALNEQFYDQAIDSFGKALDSNPYNYDIYLDRAFAYLEKGDFNNSLSDYQIYSEQKNNQTKVTCSDCIDFGVGMTTGMTTGMTKGAVESGKNLISFVSKAISHPINTSHEIYDAFSSIVKLVKASDWKTLSQSLAPEVCELIDDWQLLSEKQRGEKSGYIVGKYGTDILLPGAGVKAISKGVKGAKELTAIAKNLQKAENMIVLEALTETGGNSGAFAETLYAWKSTESNLNTASKYSKNITNLITSKKLGSSKTVINSVIKETFETKGYFTSKYALTYNEALDTGLKFLGQEYKEIGKTGSGVFRSVDGLRQFRIDKASISGKHAPNVSHFHLELLEEGAKKPVSINHIILLE